MCVTIAAMSFAQGLSMAGSAISALGALSQGRQAAATGKYQQEQAAADADAERAYAQIEAGKIREARSRTQSAARASVAASGVEVDVGTAELINQDIFASGEEDALTTVMNGATRARKLNAQGEGYAISGRNARTASALSAGSAFAKGWRSTVRPGGEY
ncbi:MAG: hypothetical protein KDH93_19140 [Rhodoferax sp.]|nr:hypothetical protein [Rhodoferax sp.]MCB2007140.1 hypothetical protein [Rhodoferax sp.]MCB2027784.1 hypothetical protein [Rhodoferax sp.]MCP5262410.1 hypothetical protein [Rhodoferax sp.]